MKKLCKSMEMLKNNKEKYISLVENGNYICGNCGRIAVDSKALCKPVLLDSNKKIEKKDTKKKRAIDGLILDTPKHKQDKNKEKKKYKVLNKEKLLKLIHKEVLKELKEYNERH